jgi:hypothetical protein
VSGLAVDDYLMLPEQHVIALNSQIFFESQNYFLRNKTALPFYEEAPSITCHTPSEH